MSRPHGVKGEVAVLALSEVDSRFEPGSMLVAGESGERRLTVASARPHGNRLLVAFEEVNDRSEAEALRGRYLFVPASSSPPLPEDSYWPHHLVGCEVVTEENRSIGRLREVIGGPANDVWVADAGDAEVLLPALKEVVKSVDVHARRIVVREVPGLTGP